MDLIRTISSEEDLAVFQRNAGLEDKDENKKDAIVSKQTERKLEFWNTEMDNMFRAVNNYVHEVRKADEKKKCQEDNSVSKTSRSCIS